MSFVVSDFYTAEGVMDKNSLWERYVPLVRHEALRLQVKLPASVELDDLLQAGGIGLLNAVESKVILIYSFNINLDI